MSSDVGVRMRCEPQAFGGGGGFREGKKMLVEEKRKDNENFPSLS